MFSKEQLQLMIAIQAEDDWNPTYFCELVKQRGDRELTAFLSRLSRSEIQDLQLALDLLGNLPN